MIDIKYKELLDLIEYQFKNIETLEEALTHSSFIKNNINNERLEFLGDRVLGLFIANYLYSTYPHSKPGDLAQRYNNLVRADTLVKVSEKIRLGSFIIMSNAEESAGGRLKPAILSDCCEALIGGIFIDGGYLVAQSFVLRQWKEFLIDSKSLEKDSKSALQEWTHANLNLNPSYKEVSMSGPSHDPIFTVEVLVEGFSPELAKGNSKQKAQQLAAKKLLYKLINKIS